MVLSKDLKIAICFGLIMGAILSLCNLCFAAELETVTFNTIENTSINSLNGKVVSGNSTLGYFEIEPGYLYHFTNNYSSSIKVVGFSDSIVSIGDTLENFSIVNAQSSFDFTYSDYRYVYFNVNNIQNNSCTREKLDGLPNFVDNIAYALSYANVNSIVANVVPILAIGVLLGLGFYLLKRLLNRIKRAKGGA